MLQTYVYVILWIQVKKNIDSESRIHMFASYDFCVLKVSSFIGFIYFFYISCVLFLYNITNPREQIINPKERISKPGERISKPR